MVLELAPRVEDAERVSLVADVDPGGLELLARDFESANSPRSRRTSTSSSGLAFLASISASAIAFELKWATSMMIELVALLIISMISSATTLEPSSFCDENTARSGLAVVGAGRARSGS